MAFDPTGPDVAGQLAAMNTSGRRLFERGQVVAANGNDADIRVGYDARGEALLLRQVPICSGYAPRVGDWVAISYEAGHSGAPWVTGPSMAADATSDSAGVGVFSVSAAAPPDPQTSTVYFDTAAGTWRGWDGSAWVDFGSSLHNHLGGIQGGAASEYYHFGQAEHDALQDFYDGSAMAAGYLKRLSFRAIDASDTQRTTVFEKDGDCYWAVNAVYDADTGTWSRVDVSKYAYLMGIYSKNGIPHEPGGLGGIAWWRCAPGANPIADYTAVGGWELGFMMTMHRNYVMGGMGLELDGSGSGPFGRLAQAGHEDPDNFTALLRNAWYQGNTGGAGDGSWGLDEASHPCWFTGFIDSDGFVLKYRAAAAGPFQTRDWIKTLTVTGDGDLWLKRNLDVDGTATIGALSGYVKGSSGTLSAVAQVPWSDLSGVPSTFPPSAHELVSASHTAAGLTVGWVLRASGATSFAWAAIQDADLPASLMRDSEHASDPHTMTIDGVDVSAHAVNANAHHNQGHVLAGGDHAASGLTAGWVLRASGASSFAWAALQDADFPASLMRDSEHASDPHTMTIDGVDVSAHAANANAHHSQSHVLAGGDHTASGLTAGWVLRASGATSFAWAALQDADLPASLMRDSEHASDPHTMTIDGVDVSAHAANANAHHNQSHVLAGNDHTASGLTAGWVLRASGASSFAWAALQASDLPSHMHVQADVSDLESGDSVTFGALTVGASLVNALTVGNRNSTTYRAVFTEQGVNAESSAVLTTDVQKGRTLALFGNGAAYFLGRDVTNDVEFGMGCSSALVAYAGSMTNHNFELRTNNTARIVMDGSGNIGFFGVSPAGRQSVTGFGSTNGTANDGTARDKCNQIIDALKSLGLFA